MNSKPKITGLYTALAYVIKLDGKVIYQAGNSPLESQVYLPETQGVGLATMKEFCEQTAKELAEQHNADFIGVEHSTESLKLKGVYEKLSPSIGKPSIAFVALW
jgi:hypothetical protein